MSIQIVVGSTDRTIPLFIEDSTSGDGDGLAGLAFDSPNLVSYYRRSDQLEATATTLVDATTTTHLDNGFANADEVSSSPVAALAGSYVYHAPDAMFASGQFVELILQGATNMVPYHMTIQIVAAPQDAVATYMTTAQSEPTGPMAANASLAARIVQTSHYTQNNISANKSTGIEQVKNDAGTVIIEHTITEADPIMTRGKGEVPA